MQKIDYNNYLDKVYGGWLGKCLGGAMGDRFEGTKSWIEIPPSEMFPEELPPNDDFDLQALWLRVLEEKGPNFTSEDLAEAFVQDCWYTFNEYGIFRRNYRIGIHPPYSGSFANQFWETGMGCAIRAEIWAYVNPADAKTAAIFSERDGIIDHTMEAVNAEKMLAGIMADAFFENNLLVLLERHIGFLDKDCITRKNIETAIGAYRQGLSLKDAFTRVCLNGGLTEACDAIINMPIIVLGLLYGDGEMEKTLHATLSCGYDCDSTMATAGSIIGQIIGAKAIPQHLKNHVEDRLVMDIAYRRPEMTISALARDTARLGLLCAKNVVFENAPDLGTAPKWPEPSEQISISYHTLPAIAPGETIRIGASLEGNNLPLEIEVPKEWTVNAVNKNTFDITAPLDVQSWSDHYWFKAKTKDGQYSKKFGIMGAPIWRVLDVIQEPEPPEPEDAYQPTRRFNISHVNPDTTYVDQPIRNMDERYRKMSALLGKPAYLVSRENEIDLKQLIGLRGSYISYLDRKVAVTSDQDAFISIGHTEPFQLYLNGELVAESKEARPWAPFNKNAAVRLKQGENHFVLKYVQRSDNAHLTFAIRERNVTNGERRGLSSPNHQDLMIGLTDVINI